MPTNLLFAYNTNRLGSFVLSSADLPTLPLKNFSLLDAFFSLQSALRDPQHWNAIIISTSQTRHISQIWTCLVATLALFFLARLSIHFRGQLTLL